MRTFVLLALTLFFLGCVQQSHVSTSSNQTVCGANKPCSSNQSIVSESAYALTFSSIDLDGNPITQEQIKGHVAIAQAFASWCTSCAVEAETIKQAYSKFAGQGVQVLYFDVMPDGESVEQVRAFRNQYGDAKWHWIAKANELPAKLGARSLEYTAVLDAGGNIVYQDNRLTNPTELNEAVEKALNG